MSDLYHDLLIYLKGYQSNQYVPIDEFLASKRIPLENIFDFIRRYFTTLHELMNDKYADIQISGSAPNITDFNPVDAERFIKYTHTEEVTISACITNAGHKYIRKYLMDIEQTKSVIKTNRFQINFGIVTFTLAVVSAAFIITSTVLQCNDTTDQELNLMKQELQKLNSTLKELAPVQKNPSSSTSGDSTK